MLSQFVTKRLPFVLTALIGVGVIFFGFINPTFSQEAPGLGIGGQNINEACPEECLISNQAWNGTTSASGGIIVKSRCNCVNPPSITCR